MVEYGKVKGEGNKAERLCVTKECSLEVKMLQKEDEGTYTCRVYTSSAGVLNCEGHEVKLISEYLYFYVLS